MTERTAAGRPTTTDPRDHQIAQRYTKAELDHINAAAAAAGKTATEYVREAALERPTLDLLARELGCTPDPSALLLAVQGLRGRRHEDRRQGDRRHAVEAGG